MSGNRRIAHCLSYHDGLMIKIEILAVLQNYTKQATPMPISWWRKPLVCGLASLIRLIDALSGYLEADKAAIPRIQGAKGSSH